MLILTYYYVAQDEDSRDDGKPLADVQASPDFVFAIEASDAMIKQRIMKLPESQVAGTRNSEEGKCFVKGQN